jgi:hypothetical protein
MSTSVDYFLSNAFDYEIRNYIETRKFKLNQIDDMTEEEIDELQKLESVKEYLQERIGEMKKKAA